MTKTKRMRAVSVWTIKHAQDGSLAYAYTFLTRREASDYCRTMWPNYVPVRVEIRELKPARKRKRKA